MNTILVPLDGSELACHILPYARMLAMALEANVRLLHVITDVYPQPQHQPVLSDQHTLQSADLYTDRHNARSFTMQRHITENCLDKFAWNLRREGLNVKIDVQFGVPATCIVDAARRTNATMIAMPTHGYTGFQRLRLGSVTDSVVHATHTPVFIVRSDVVTQATRQPMFRRLLIPLDGTATSRQALPIASRLASKARADIHLMRVASPELELHTAMRWSGVPETMHQDILPDAPCYDVTPETHQHITEYLTGIANELRHTGANVSTRMAIGDAAEAIVKEAAMYDSDVIVMATRGHTGLRRWALGSVADRVLHKTTRPLLLVHART